MDDCVRTIRSRRRFLLGEPLREELYFFVGRPILLHQHHPDCLPQSYVTIL
jgi:hypothetical protein